MTDVVYTAIIHKNKRGCGASFPDFPGCIISEDTVAEVIASAEQALALHIVEMRENGEAIPEPSTVREALRETYPPGTVVTCVRARKA